MKLLVLIATLSGMLVVPGIPLAGQASEGEPFGKGVVSPAAKNGEIKEAVHENVPGGLDEVVHENLADDGETGAVRGLGKTDAPGRNK